MKFIRRFYWILKHKVYLAKMKSLPKHHGAGPHRRGAQCSCIGCIGLRPALGVGAGKFWVLTRIYARIRPNSPEKFLCDFSLDIKTFFGVTPKKGLTVFFFGFGRSQMLAAIFVQIFRDFSRIFDKSKLLCVRLITPCPSPPTPLKWVFS